MKNKPYFENVSDNLFDKQELKVLLIYPEYPDTFWSFKYALEFISRKAANPPLGLLTVAAMLPESWHKKVVDMNVSSLKDKDIDWADFVFISAMIIQKESVKKVIQRCKNRKVKIVGGGPLFTVNSKEFQEIDHFVLGEAEDTISLFLKDMQQGSVKKLYQTRGYPNLEKTPLPMWELVNIKQYATMNIQYSRGCPYNCEFCNITSLFGRKVRVKSKYQIIAELDHLYFCGWRGNVFFVDDNFIGNKTQLKKELLPAIIQWMKRRKNPFSFSTEASINLADDTELMNLMTHAGFEMVFIGIETPDTQCLAECNKFQNTNRNLVESVKTIQRSGLRVSGGFIVGFDSDKPSIFKRQIDFIQQSSIVTAMVGLLHALPETKLYNRLKKEQRILNEASGNNTDFSLNFIPKMDSKKLIEGYHHILNEIYSLKRYYERIIHFLKERKFKNKQKASFSLSKLIALFKSIIILGIKEKGRKYYWKLFFWSLFRKPAQFPTAITLAIYGFHFRKVFGTM